MKPEDEVALRVLAGLPKVRVFPRSCGSPVGKCYSKDHVHPNPWSQMLIEDWVESERERRDNDDALS